MDGQRHIERRHPYKCKNADGRRAHKAEQHIGAGVIFDAAAPQPGAQAGGDDVDAANHKHSPGACHLPHGKAEQSLPQQDNQQQRPDQPEAAAFDGKHGAFLHFVQLIFPEKLY